MLAIYRPPSSPIPEFLDEFDDLTANPASAAGRVVITGYFNLHVDVCSAPGVSRFMDLLQIHDLHQHVDCSTHKAGHTLDLVISRATDPIISKVSVTSSEISDNKSVTFSIEHTADKNYPQAKLQPRRDLRHVDCKTLTSEINSNLSGFDTSPTYPDSILDIYTCAVISALDEIAPSMLRRPRKRRTPTWYCEELHAMRKLSQNSALSESTP